MVRARYIMVAGLIALGANVAWAQEFPKAPPQMKEAEAQGLTRVGIKELKAFIPGSIRLKGVRGVEKTKIFHEDGTLTVLDIRDKHGTWHFNKQIDGYCNNIDMQKKNVRACLNVFKAPDGVHYFNYEVKSGHFAEVWRPLPKE